jgi:hypothetical protein
MFIFKSVDAYDVPKTTLLFGDELFDRARTCSGLTHMESIDSTHLGIFRTQISIIVQSTSGWLAAP